MVCRPSLASASTSVSTFSNDVPSKTAEPIEIILDVAPPWGRGKMSGSHDLGGRHPTKCKTFDNIVRRSQLAVDDLGCS